MKLSQIARALGGELRGDGGVEIVDVAPIEDAPPGTLTFLADRRLAPRLATTRAAAVPRLRGRGRAAPSAAAASRAARRPERRDRRERAARPRRGGRPARRDRR